MTMYSSIKAYFTATSVTITKFNPLTIAWPNAPLAGKIRLVLPPIHIQVYDLSMGIDLLKGAHLGGDAPILGIDIELSESINKGDLMNFIEATKDKLEELWSLGQKEFNKKGALL